MQRVFDLIVVFVFYTYRRPTVFFGRYGIKEGMSSNAGIEKLLKQKKSNAAVSAAPAQFPTSNRCCIVGVGVFILLFNLLSLKLASLPEL